MSEKENILYIENDYMKLGINLDLGGAVTYLAEHGQKNLINSFDWGRQVQMSFYSYPVPFQPEGVSMRESWRTIGWNPIQAGDCYGHGSRVLEAKKEGSVLYVKSIPMHWPLDNYPGECTFETWYQLEGNRVDVTARINNSRPDTTQYPAREQELPAVYTNGEWYRQISYIGTEPYTEGKLTEVCSKEEGHNWPCGGAIYIATENWAALVNEEDYGLGVYSPVTGYFSGGFAGDGTGGPKDYQTGYISPFAQEIMDHNIQYTYGYSLIVGTVEEIRKTAVAIGKRSNCGKYSFEQDRNHFYYKDITDRGYPTGGCLDFAFPKDSVLKSPVLYFNPGECKRMILDAEFEGGVIPVTIEYTVYDGKDHPRGYEFPKKQLERTIEGDGTRKMTVLDLAEIQDAMINIDLCFRKEGHAKIYSVEFAE